MYRRMRMVETTEVVTHLKSEALWIMEVVENGTEIERQRSVVIILVMMNCDRMEEDIEEICNVCS